MDASLLDLFWEGFHPSLYQSPTQDTLLIRLVATRSPECSGCGASNCKVHDYTVRRVRERDILQYRTWLEVPVRRVRCPACGPRVETISWLPERSRMTYRMRHWVETLACLLPVKHVAELLALHWHTVKAIDHLRLKREVRQPNRVGLRRLIMDEFALYKGHRYATVAICADTQQVLWVGEGRSREAVRPFFEWLGKEACQRIEAVAMDMNTAMDLEVQAHCPNARVVYDLFHVIAKFGREVIDRVRVDQANALRDDRTTRQVVKRSRWLLLRNRENLAPGQDVKLDELLTANQPLMAVYVLKQQLKELWYAPDETEARRRWRDWCRLVSESGLEPARRFCRRLSGYVEGIIASATYRLNTSVLEGMNNKIKVIKRMAYGYRDNDYFFLKIKAAFPGKVR